MDHISFVILCARRIKGPHKWTRKKVQQRGERYEMSGARLGYYACREINMMGCLDEGAQNENQFFTWSEMKSDTPEAHVILS